MKNEIKQKYKTDKMKWDWSNINDFGATGRNESKFSRLRLFVCVRCFHFEYWGFFRSRDVWAIHFYAPRFRHATKYLEIVASGAEDSDDESGEYEDGEKGDEKDILEIESSPQKTTIPKKKDKNEARRRIPAKQHRDTPPRS